MCEYNNAGIYNRYSSIHIHKIVYYNVVPGCPSPPDLTVFGSLSHASKLGSTWILSLLLDMCLNSQVRKRKPVYM